MDLLLETASTNGFLLTIILIIAMMVSILFATNNAGASIISGVIAVAIALPIYYIEIIKPQEKIELWGSESNSNKFVLDNYIECFKPSTGNALQCEKLVIDKATREIDSDFSKSVEESIKSYSKLLTPIN